MGNLCIKNNCRQIHINAYKNWFHIELNKDLDVDVKDLLVAIPGVVNLPRR